MLTFDKRCFFPTLDVLNHYDCNSMSGAMLLESHLILLHVSCFLLLIYFHTLGQGIFCATNVMYK